MTARPPQAGRTARKQIVGATVGVQVGRQDGATVDAQVGRQDGASTSGRQNGVMARR